MVGLFEYAENEEAWKIRARIDARAKQVLALPERSRKRIELELLQRQDQQALLRLTVHHGPSRNPC